MQRPRAILRIATLRVKAASKLAIFTLIAASRNRYTRAWTFCTSNNTSQPQMLTIPNPCPKLRPPTCSAKSSARIALPILVRTTPSAQDSPAET